MKPVFKIGRSEDLNTSQANLLMEIGETHCCFAITDHIDQMMMQSVYYAAEGNDRDDMLKNVLQIHPELKATIPANGDRLLYERKYPDPFKTLSF